MGVACQASAAATGRLVCELKAQGHHEGEDTFEERLPIAKQLEVRRFAPEIDSDGAVFSRRFRRCAHVLPLCHRSRKLRRHSEGNALQSQDHCEGLRVLPLKAMECGNFHYLLGLVIHDEGKVNHHYFWADNKDEETMIFQQFLALLRQYPVFTLFHYGSYEAKYLQKMRRSLGDETAQYLEQIIKSSCNLLSFFYSHIYLPTYTNGIKEIANFLGFQWTAGNASGLQSIVWRKTWEDTHDEHWKDKLIVYNKEDCLALMKVKNLIYAIVENESSNQCDGYETVYPKNLKRNSIFSFQDKNYALPEMEDINKYSMFDYQRERVHVRTNGYKKKVPSRTQAHDTEKPTIDAIVTIDADTCPACGTARIKKLSYTLSKSIVDLEFFDC